VSTAAYPAWTIRLNRDTPGAQDAADYARAQGATVVWHEEDSVRIPDDPGLAGPPAEPPAEEHRGGEHPDWANARPGEELPELPELPDPGLDGEG
jgi:hypothetical protein